MQLSEQPLPVAGTHKWLEYWWIRIPALLRDTSVLLSEAWRDGIYLTRWPGVGLVAPLMAFLLGAIEGATHWTISINQFYDPQSVAFTELFLFLICAATIGAFSANLGLQLTLGYALGDFFIAGPRVSFYFGRVAAIGQPFIPDDTLWNTILFLRVPQLISYIVLFMLAVQPTLFARNMASNIRPFLKKVFGKKTSGIILIEALVGGLVQGGIVYIWTLSTPVVIRIFWGWLNQAPPVEAAYFLQNFWIWIVLPAGGAVVVRGIIAFWAFHSESTVHNRHKQEKAIAEADALRPRAQSIISAISRALLIAGVTTLLLSGIIGTVGEGLIVFCFIGTILLLRSIVLSRLRFWNAWKRYLAEVPLILRLAYGGYIAYQLTQLALSYYMPDTLPVASASASMFPILISSGISLLILTIFLPRG
jgi:hypothetical protein